MIYFQIYLLIFCVIVILTVSYFKYCFQYWKRKKVPYIQPTFPFGNLGNPVTRKTHTGIWLKNVYDYFKNLGVKHGGVYFFSRAYYVPIDLEYIKNIMQKDFQYFIDRGFYYNEKDDPLSAHLFAIGGQKWRNLRIKLTPTFTSGKMKLMISTVVECAYQMKDALDNTNKSNHQPIDIKDVLACFTTDVIGSCAFGLKCNSFESPNAEFRKYGKKIFSFGTTFKIIQLYLAFLTPSFARKIGITITPKDSADFFLKVVKETMQFRKANNFVRKDMLQLLIDLDDGITFEEIAAQAFVFFVAGFETSSTTMTFCLYELACNPKIQEKLRQEINDTLGKYNGAITYENILDMKYMSQVIDETLRKYPPLPMVTRECVMNYKIPNTEIVLEKGIKVMIPIYALHKDPQYFCDPEKFDPNRFSEENKKMLTPFTYLPFGEGPRLCIGMRFGIMQIKVGLSILLKNYIFSINPKTKIPFEMDRFSFVLSSKTGIWLDIKKIN